LPNKLNALTGTASYGSWFNFYLCDFDGRIVLPSAKAVRRAGAGSGAGAGPGGAGDAGCGGTAGRVGTPEPGGAVLLFGGVVTVDLPHGHPSPPVSPPGPTCAPVFTGS
ncbi:hypothetical protein ACWDAQ_39705, partial [Streptomyces sp. NPDC001139]